MAKKIKQTKQVKEYLREIARRGGLSKSPAKARAARLNGLKGGRSKMKQEAKETPLNIETVSPQSLI